MRSAARSPPATRTSAATSWLRVASASMLQQSCAPRPRVLRGGVAWTKRVAHSGATVTRMYDGACGKDAGGGAAEIPLIPAPAGIQPLRAGGIIISNQLIG